MPDIDCHLTITNKWCVLTYFTKIYSQLATPIFRQCTRNTFDLYHFIIRHIFSLKHSYVLQTIIPHPVKLVTRFDSKIL